ncbi:MAG: hypothetical protein QOD30_1623 [Actinomycetota bacterium]|nr:hypothetical protein [Actinomycetota bacterium]
MRPEVYGRIAGRASSQLGLITYEQLDDIGVTTRQRRTMIGSGAWLRRGRRVLADASAPATDEQRLFAATLDVDREAGVTATSAAWLVGVQGFRPRPVHVLTKRGGNHRPVNAVLHETFWLPPHHLQIVRGVPSVSNERLVFELAPLLKPQRLRRIADWLKSARGMSYDAMALTAAELWRRGKPGSAEMRLLVDERLPGYVPPASELEAAFRDLCARFGLPQGVRQLDAGGTAWIGRVDVAYARSKLLVELDSRQWHDTSSAFEDDRNRTNALVLAGWRVVRITWRMIHDAPERVASLLHSLLHGVA